MPDHIREMGFNREAAAIVAEVAELSREYAALLTEYDELTGTVRPNLEAAYMLQLGRREHRLFALQLQIQQLKREISLYQAAANHGQTVTPAAVAAVIQQEFAEYRAQLDAQKEKIRQAEELHFAKKLSDADSKALKDLYHNLVRRLHPDLNPDLPPEAGKLWNKIAQAYKSWDWQELNLLADMAYDLLDGGEIAVKTVNSLEALLLRKTGLTEKIAAVRQKTAALRRRPPFTYEELLKDPAAVRARCGELDELRTRFEEHLQQLTAVRDELRGGNYGR